MKRANSGSAILVIFLWANASLGFGGQGGSNEGTFKCREGKIVKIYGRSGQYIDSIGATCSDGSVSSPLMKTVINKNVRADSQAGGNVVGGNGGAPFKFESPSGFWAMNYQAGRFVDGITPISNDEDKTRTFGGSGGQQGTFICPDGQNIVGFKVKWGEFVDNLEPLCK